MGFLTSPSKVELLYSVSPDVLKPNAQVQATLIKLVKTEAAERIANGESLTFRFGVAGLFTVEVTPSGEGVPLPRHRGNVELVVRRKDAPNGAPALVKQVEQFLLS